MCIITCNCCPIIVTSQIYITHVQIGAAIESREIWRWSIGFGQLMNSPFDDDDCGAIPPHLVSLTNTPKLGS